MTQSPPTLIVLISSFISGFTLILLIISISIINNELYQIEVFGQQQMVLVDEQSELLWTELLSISNKEPPRNVREARALSTGVLSQAFHVESMPPSPPIEEDLVSSYGEDEKSEGRTYATPIQTFKKRLKLKSYGEPTSEYGYAYTKLKCCCVGNTGPGQNENLPTSYKCPTGKPGPTGSTGPPGLPGDRGRSGYPGQDAPPAYIIPLPCVVCPQGPPGPPGCKGSMGSRGSRGVHGPRGDGGYPGLQGPPGTPGDAGGRGMSGKNGVKGPPGADGIKGAKGPRGPKGLPGLQGVIGPAGVAGQPGEYGPPGKLGKCGAPGNKGGNGLDGPEGQIGIQGTPGDDGEYCPCPAKSQPGVYQISKPSYNTQTQSSDFYSTSYNKENNDPPQIFAPSYTPTVPPPRYTSQSTTHTASHLAQSDGGDPFIPKHLSWPHHNRFITETSTYGIDEFFLHDKKKIAKS